MQASGQAVARRESRLEGLRQGLPEDARSQAVAGRPRCRRSRPRSKRREPPDVADAPLESALVDQLVAGWTEDPKPSSSARIARRPATPISAARCSARCVAELAGKHVWPVYRSLHGQLRDIRKYALGQPKVRRALANVPTYMIFDDHDVTDDWNLNPEWCKRVFAADAVRKQPLGRQIVRNALRVVRAVPGLGQRPRALRGGRAGPAGAGAGAAACSSDGAPVAAHRPPPKNSIACSASTSCRSRSTRRARTAATPRSTRR